ncbi:hypothetical protein M3Y98_00838800 [Aphelenchoides besseyi]|nr:hypothetical protein M3Y98_00838800 [Aphelenchoides besseyi]
MAIVFPRLLLVVYSFAIFFLMILLLLAIHALHRFLNPESLDQKLSKNLTISLVTWTFVIHAAVYVLFTYICDHLLFSILFTIYGLFVGINCTFSCVHLDDYQLILSLTSWIMFFLVLTRFFAVENTKDDYQVFAKHGANSPLLLNCNKFRSSAPIVP